MSLSPRLIAVAVVASLAFAAPVAFACAPTAQTRERAAAKARERVTGQVVNFGPRDIVLRYGGATVLVQYPHFKRSGNMLYQQAFNVETDEQFWGLYRALRGSKAVSANVALEQVGTGWRLVSWSRV